MVRSGAAPLRVGHFQRDAVGNVLRVFRRDEAGLDALFDELQRRLAAPGIGQILAGRFSCRQHYLVARIGLRRTVDMRLRRLATDAVAAQQFRRADQVGLYADGASRINDRQRVAAVHQDLPHDLGGNIAQATLARQALQPRHAACDDGVGGRRAAVSRRVQIVLTVLPVRGRHAPAPAESVHAAAVFREPRSTAQHRIGRAHINGA
ncbi:hypothetical protein D3C87_1426930 [compost metagenome]